MKTIILSHSAAKSLDRLPDDTRARIGEAMVTYATAGIGDSKAMTGTPTVRLRIGDFRVIFDETATSIHILALGNRREIYR